MWAKSIIDGQFAYSTFILGTWATVMPGSILLTEMASHRYASGSVSSLLLEATSAGTNLDPSSGSIGRVRNVMMTSLLERVEEVWSDEVVEPSLSGLVGSVAFLDSHSSIRPRRRGRVDAICWVESDITNLYCCKSLIQKEKRFSEEINMVSSYIHITVWYESLDNYRHRRLIPIFACPYVSFPHLIRRVTGSCHAV